MVKYRKKRKYLHDLGVDANYSALEPHGRANKWKKQRMTYGFDERDTWSLDITMLELLFERLMMYKEANRPITEVVRLTQRDIDYKSEVYTLQELVDKLIAELRFVIVESSKGTCGEYALVNHLEIWKLWGVISPYMWW